MAEKRKKRGRFAFKNSIAMRWMFNSLSIIGITLVAAETKSGDKSVCSCRMKIFIENSHEKKA